MRLHLLILLVVSSMLLSVNTALCGLDEHVMGLWLFDESSGTKVMDSSKNGNNGTLKGDGEWTKGMFNGGLGFNGSDTYVEVPSSASLEISKEITIEFWMFPRALTGNPWNILRKHTENTYNYEIYTDADGTTWFDAKVFEVNTALKIGDDQIPFEKWTHLAFTYDGKKAIMYIDGENVFEQAATGEIPTSDGTLYIGCRDSTARFINAILDELCLSDIARTPDELKDHVTKGIIGASPVSKAGKLVSKWSEIKNKLGERSSR